MQTLSVASPSRISGATNITDSSTTRSMAGRSRMTAAIDQEANDPILREECLIEAKLFSRFFAIIPEEDPAVKEVQALVNECATIARFNPDEIPKLLIYVSEMPDAFIFKSTGQIVLGSGLLEALNYSKSKLRTVINHELAHYLRGHYREVPNRLDLGEMAKGESLFRRIDNYQEEFTADRIAAILSARSGSSPRAMSRALIAIDQYYEKLWARGTDTDKKYDNSGWVFNSHPFTARRSRANNLVSRLLDEGSLNDLETLQQHLNIKLDKGGDPIEMQAPTWPIKEIKKGDIEYAQSSLERLFPGDIADWGCQDDFDQFWFNAVAISKDNDIEASKHLINFINGIGGVEGCNREQLKLLLMKCDAVALVQVDGMYGFLDKDLDGLEPVASLILDRYIQLSQEGGFDDMSILKEAFEMIHDQRLAYGISLWITNSSFIKLFETAFDKNPNQCLATLAAHPGTRDIFIDSLLDRTNNQDLYKKIIDYCIDNKITLTGLKDRESTVVEAIKNHADYCETVAHFELVNLVNILCVDSHSDEFKIEVINDKQVQLYIPRRVILDKDLKELDNAIRQNFQKRGLIGEINLEPSTKDKLKGKLQKFADRLSSSKEELQKFIQEEVKIKLSSKSVLNWLNRAQTTHLDNLKDHLREEDPEIKGLINGEAAFEAEYLTDAGRASYKPLDYRFQEQGSATIRYLINIWERAYRDDFNQLGLGLEKANFAIDSLPIACPSRDKLIVNAINYPQLNLMDDITQVQTVIGQEGNFELLFFLRDNLHSPVLSLYCSDRIYELIKQDPNSVTSNSLLRAKYAGIEEQLQANQGFDLSKINQAESLLQIFTAYTQPSIKRDYLLKFHIDQAPNNRMREIISGYLTEPPINSLEQISAKATALNETLLEAIQALPSVNKSDFLLYLMGQRDFQSIYVNDYKFNPERLVALNNLKNIQSRHNFTQPDCIMRLSKTLGVDPERLLETERTSFSRREKHEFLYSILFGKTGILDDGELAEHLPVAVARNLLNKPHLNQSLSLRLREFFGDCITLIIKECPREKLVDLFIDLWTASADTNSKLPELTVGMLRSLGPAFIKLGQRLTAMKIPADWKLAFRNLCSRNDVSDSTLITEYLFRVHGPKADDIEVGRKLGEGSLAATYQVSKPIDQISLKTGAPEQIALKVYHPFIKRELDDDIGFIRKIIDFVNNNKDATNGLYIPENTADIVGAEVLEQCDPELEAIKAERLQSVLSPMANGVRLIAPEVDKSIGYKNVDGSVRNTSNLLGLKFQRGIELDKDAELRAQGLDPQQLRNAVGLEILKQIFQNKFYQSDPNWGNFAGRKNAAGQPEVPLYDAGSVKAIQPEDQKLLLTLIKQLANKANSTDLANIFLDLIEPSTITDKNITKDLLVIWLDEARENFSKGFDFSKLESIINGFIDHVASEGLIVKDKWISLMNTFVLLKPYIEDCPDKVESVILASMKQANVLSFAERLLLNLRI